MSLTHHLQTNYCDRGYILEARVAYADSASPFTTKLQVKPGRTGSVTGLVTFWVQPRAESHTWDSRE